MTKAPQANFPAFETEMLLAWSNEHTFEQSLKQREGAPRFSFYDGPPFANGLPHFGHTLVASIKDSLGRYKTMQGYYVERRNGWDTHGLPVEFEIEKKLGVSGKKQILELGLREFNDACRASVFTYRSDWEDFYRRIGRWTDTEHAYATLDRDFTESVWWMLGQVHAKTVDGQSLLYRGYKSMPYCPRCETPLSNFEVNEGYKDNVPDPSVYVKFKLADEDASLLAWTTTPWSLPGNAALAVNPAATYVYARVALDGGGSEVLVLAKDRLEALNAEFTVLKEVTAEEITGRTYVPLYDNAPGPYRVWASDIASIEEGTGVLHVAPAFGEADLSLAQDHAIAFVNTVKPNGHLDEQYAMPDAAKDKFFKGADKAVIEALTESGHIYAAETFTHTYPFCYRCDTPLLYYAISTWFVRVSAIRDQLKATADQINWQPGHIKNGRFGKWLDGARDWAISRNRYWGAPLPIWANVEDPGDYIVITSLDELVQAAGLDAKPDDLHRPAIDDIEIVRDGKTYRRIDEVFDCWFESGSMPAAQHHYPFENRDVFEASFPADYIGEGLDQTRLWFYVQHVLSTIVFDRPAYKNVLVNGMVMAADGRKLSKSLKNYPPVDEVFASEGADTLRFYLLGNDQAVGADYMRFNRDAMKDVQRGVFGTLWNTYSFLSMYAEIDGWQPTRTLTRPTSANLLDQWLLARLDETIGEMTTAADAYQLARALRPLRGLVDDLSNWYVRRSRRRFWKSEDDGDKASAYATLHYALVVISQLLAPWTPFVADKLWRGLTAGMDVPASVHLSDWPAAQPVKESVLTEMAQVRQLVEKGLAQRGTAKVKVRQPLASLTVYGGLTLSEQAVDIIKDEVNVKAVVSIPEGETGSVQLDLTITDELRLEGLMRDLVRSVQAARKAAGLEVDDRIDLVLAPAVPDGDLARAIDAHRATIMAETLAATLGGDLIDGAESVKVGGETLQLSLKKAA